LTSIYDNIIIDIHLNITNLSKKRWNNAQWQEQNLSENYVEKIFIRCHQSIKVLFISIAYFKVFLINPYSCYFGY
jgi:hypothetical protein